MKKILLSVAFSAIVLSASAQDGVFYSEDFEWLEDWAVASNAGSTVETDDLNASAPALTSLKTEIDGQEITCFAYIESKGYKFVYDKDDNKRTYLQRNYLKFGKTGNHSGITLPSISNVPAGTATTLTFDWCPMRQGSGKIDPVTLFVEVANGEDVQKVYVPVCEWENGHTLEWIHASVDLSDFTITADTKLTISQEEFGKGTANRWYLDNLKLWDSAKLAAINEVATDVVDENAPVEYFNLQGVSVNADNLSNGIYVRRQGSKTSKVIVR